MSLVLKFHGRRSVSFNKERSVGSHCRGCPERTRTSIHGQPAKGPGVVPGIVLLSPPNGCLRMRKLDLHDLPKTTQSAGGLAEGRCQVSLLGQPGCGLEIMDVSASPSVPSLRADPAAGEQEPEKSQSADSTRVPLALSAS